MQGRFSFMGMLMAEDSFFEPTEAEIREACREIQAGWSVDEERRRRVVGPRSIDPAPVMPCVDERVGEIGVWWIPYDPEPLGDTSR